MYGQDEAFVVYMVVVGFVILLVCLIAEYFCEKDR